MTGVPENLGGAVLSVILLLVFGIVRLLAGWIQSAPVTPDPWGQEAEVALAQAETLQVCHRCSAPQEPGAWFCPHCGSAVGPYNNWMPYVYVFSEGEVFRNGVMDRLRAGPLIVIGYILLSFDYLILAPIYLVLVLRNLARQRSDSAPGAADNRGG